MKKMLVLCASLLTSVSTFAALQSLDDQSMSAADAQGALKLELDLRLNSTGGFGASGEINPLTDRPLNQTGELCFRSPEACRLGVRLNGQTEWLVLKGLSLSLRIPELLLETSDLSYTNDSGVLTYVSGVKASLGLKGGAPTSGTFGYTGGMFTANSQKIGINLNVESIAFHSDNSATATLGYRALNGVTAAATNNGNNPAYTDGKYATVTNGTVGAFDSGKEVGFLGLAIKGNIAVNGSVTTFGCAGAHPRC